MKNIKCILLLLCLGVIFQVQTSSESKNKAEQKSAIKLMNKGLRALEVSDFDLAHACAHALARQEKKAVHNSGFATDLYFDLAFAYIDKGQFDKAHACMRLGYDAWSGISWQHKRFLNLVKRIDDENWDKCYKQVNAFQKSADLAYEKLSQDPQEKGKMVRACFAELKGLLQLGSKLASGEQFVQLSDCMQALEQERAQEESAQDQAIKESGSMQAICVIL